MIPILLTAFTAGLVATVNPCGFAMLPAYLGYFLGIDETADRKTITAVGHALRTGAVVSSGFLLVFGTAGTIIVAGVRSLTTILPWVALIVGVGLVGLGIALLRGHYLTIRLPSIRGKKDRTNGSLFVFGISYAIASLSCTLPIFLSLVATTFTQTTFLAGFAAFISYGLGMSLVLIGVTVLLALGKDTLVRKLRGAAQYINNISGVVMILAGGFIVWYWATILRSGAGALGDNALVRFIDGLSAMLTTLIGDSPLTAAMVVLAVIAVPIGVLWARRRNHENAGTKQGAGRS
jgi:cytochrome c biogenesis protein CcdA